MIRGALNISTCFLERVGEEEEGVGVAGDGEGEGEGLSVGARDPIHLPLSSWREGGEEFPSLAELDQSHRLHIER